MSGQKRLRVSYVIPPPNDRAPRLQLPSLGTYRNGAIGPILQPYYDTYPKSNPESSAKLPRHRLGVVCLALDRTTRLMNKSSPEGILYSGGRDGQVISHDLGLPMKRRTSRIQYPCNWEGRTRWEEDSIDEEETDGPGLSDILGRTPGDKNATSESLWEADMSSFKPGQAMSFRQCSQTHSDWINDIALCNQNQTVVSASSDGQLRYWNPHGTGYMEPSLLGAHSDYVRCLAYPREQNWIASGSFDRTIKLWNISRSGDPIITLNPPDTNSPKASVYALATDPFGRCIASGSPERVVRIWDPRSGKRTAKLVGHTDNIRTIVISDDSKYLLTGSADTSIKLWSLSAQRCLHTFNYHAESVWSLYSSHSSLETFYSGDKSGVVCRVDVEGCGDISDGECIVLCRETGDANEAPSGGVNKMEVIEDGLLFTASGSSSISRWRVPPRRTERASGINNDPRPSESPTFFRRSPDIQRGMRDTPPSNASPGRQFSFSTSNPFTSSSEYSLSPQEDGNLYGIPFGSLIKLASPNDNSAYFLSSAGRDPEVATMYSAASIGSGGQVPGRPPMSSMFRSSTRSMHSETHLRSQDDVSQVESSARAAYEDRESCTSATPLQSSPDYVLQGDRGLIRAIILNNRMHALTVDVAGEVAVWDIVRSVCLGFYTQDDVVLAASGPNNDGKDDRSPRKALEAVRERIEGEASVSTWSSVDTKCGVLTIHVNDKCFEAEIYADEVGYRGDKRFPEEVRLNIGRWVLRNLFLGIIREEQRIAHETTELIHASRETLSATGYSSTNTSDASLVISSPTMVPANASAMPPPIPPKMVMSLQTNDLWPPPNPATVKASSTDDTPMPATLGSAGYSDYFSLKARSPQTPGETAKTPLEPPTPNTPTAASGAGLMGRLKTFGKKKVGTESGQTTLTAEVVAGQVQADLVERLKALPPEQPKTPRQILLSQKINAPPSREAPTVPLPADVAIWITEDAYPAWKPIYRGTVDSIVADRKTLKELMPMWLLEFLWNNLSPSIPPAKISFVLLPWPNPAGPTLPELLNTTQSKLTASRYLRVRKLCIHVQDKLDKMNEISNAASRPQSDLSSSSSMSSLKSTKSRADETYQILCNDTVLSLDMTLAAIRQFVWRQASELTMYYRLLSPTPDQTPLTTLYHAV